MSLVTSVLNRTSLPGSPVSCGRNNMAAAMKMRMPLNCGSESSDLDDVTMALALAAIARKRRGKQRKMKAAPTDQ